MTTAVHWVHWRSPISHHLISNISSELQPNEVATTQDDDGRRSRRAGDGDQEEEIGRRARSAVVLVKRHQASDPDFDRCGAFQKQVGGSELGDLGAAHGRLRGINSINTNIGAEDLMASFILWLESGCE